MADEGATSHELILEACRRDNPSLLTEVLSHQSSPSAIAQLLNTTRDPLGNHCLHLAARAGAYSVLDILLDQPGVEVDPLTPTTAAGYSKLSGGGGGDTPLHKAVEFVNTLGKGEWEEGRAVVEILVDAGCDPRVRNRGKMRAVDLVDGGNEGLREFLRRAEMVVVEGGDVVNEEEGEREVGEGSESD